MAFKRKTTVADLAGQMKDRAAEEPEAVDLGEWDTDNLIPSGSTLLNLACSDNPMGAFCKGKIVNIIGDPSAGKTLLALTIVAEMSIDSKWDDYDIYYDPCESGDSFNIEKTFGKRLADRLKPPFFDEEGVPDSSDTVQRFHATLDRILDGDKPFVYILDSLDGLSSLEEQANAEARHKALENNKKIKGSYGGTKPKSMSELLRLLNRRIKRTGSLLIILSQTRDNLDAGPFQPKKTVTGGKALEFYCAHRIWLYKAGHIDKMKRKIGTHTQARVTKNKLTGKLREVDFDVYYDYGVDDHSSCIGFLLDEGVFKAPGTKKGKEQDEDGDSESESTKKKGLPKAIVAEALGYAQAMSPEQLVLAVDEFNLKPALVKLTADKWTEIEESLKLNRTPKYQ